jgi:hypothetical protein
MEIVRTMLMIACTRKNITNALGMKLGGFGMVPCDSIHAAKDIA